MLKYSLGLDISAKDIHCCLSMIDQVQKVTVKSSRKISNNVTGFTQMLQWLDKHYKKKEVPLVVTMEATGVYFEHCALFLYKNGYNVSVVLPNRAKKYLQSTGLKSKNDKIDAQGLSRMGAEQALDFWEPMGEYFYQLRTLTRYHQSLQESKTALCNQLHADERGMYVNEQVIAMLRSHIAMTEEQLGTVEKAIKKHIHSNAEVAAKVENICKIKGVALHTVAVTIAETNGFLLFGNTRQLVSYAGYDVIQNESGKHKGKTRISKKGNGRLRRALYMPAFNVVRYKVKPFVGLYERTLNKHNLKMKSYVAVQKKLLVMIYTLWKNNEAFDENYSHESSVEKEPVLSLGSEAIAEVTDSAEIKSSAGISNATQGKRPCEGSPFASSRLLQR